MYCLQCGVKLPEGARFCPSCGCCVAAVAEAMVRAPPPWSTHALHTMPQSSSAAPAIQGAKADELLKECEVSDKPMATNQVRVIALKDATSQRATSKITMKPNKPNRTVAECICLHAGQRNLMEMGLKRSIQSASGRMIPLAAHFTETPKKRYRCERCPQWPGTDHPPAWVQHQRKHSGWSDIEKNCTVRFTEWTVPGGIDESIVKLAYHMIACHVP